VGGVDGDAGADVAGGLGGSGVGVADVLVAGAGDEVVGAGTFDSGAVTLLLLDDLQEATSNAAVVTTMIRPLRRCTSGS
jgi:hypothetical protein